MVIEQKVLGQLPKTIIEAQYNLWEQYQTSHQGGYDTGSNNLFGMKGTFEKLEQATPEN